MEATDIIRSVEVTDTSICFVLTGELDIVSTPDAREAIVSAAARSPEKSIVIDLRQVGFMDSAGVMLLILCHRSEVTNRALRIIVRPDTQPHRILKIGRFDRILNIET